MVATSSADDRMDEHAYTFRQVPGIAYIPTRTDVHAALSSAPDIQPSSSAGTRLETGKRQTRHQVWSEKDVLHLVKLGRDEEYRRRVTGSSALDWEVIGLHVGRTKGSAKQKFSSLDRVALSPSGDSLIWPVNEGKKWNDDEARELLRLGDPTDASYRQKRLGTVKVDWNTLATHFGRLPRSVAIKYKYERKKMETFSVVEGDGVSLAGMSTASSASSTTPSRSACGNDTNGFNNHRTMSYNDMIIEAILEINPTGLEVTSRGVCEYVSSHPAFSGMLDRSVPKGKKSMPVWKHRIRDTLYRHKAFKKTGQTIDGETIWSLDLGGIEGVETYGAQARAGYAPRNLEQPWIVAPITLDQILEHNISAEQLAMLPPEQISYLRNQLDAGL